MLGDGATVQTEQCGPILLPKPEQDGLARDVWERTLALIWQH